MSFEIVKPSKGKLFANSGETELYSALILSHNDSIDNYHEVDELTEILVESNDDERETDGQIDNYDIVITPDDNGKISYEDAEKLIKRLSILTQRVIDLSEKLNNGD